MSFLHVDSKALEIPGRMELDELAFLAALAARVPKGGQIVEVGAFYGRSTNAIANANPEAQITTIDTFEDVAWTKRYAKKFRGVPKFGYEAFETYTGHHNNINVIQGFSPNCASNWTTPIDMYFEDAIHGNPGFVDNLNFWVSKLKPGGVVCGHDYNRKFPDVKTEVDALAALWRSRPSIVGSLWALQKPRNLTDTPCHLELQIGSAPQIRIRASNKKRGPCDAPSGYWCGAHLDPDRLNWLLIDSCAMSDTICLHYRLAHPTFGASDWFQTGHKAQLIQNGKAKPFTHLAVKATTSNNDELHVNYRVSARQIGNGGSWVSGVSSWASNGEWAGLPYKSPPINAVTVTLSKDHPIRQQSAFSPRTTYYLSKLPNAIARKLFTAG